MLKIIFSFLLILSIGVSTLHHHADGRDHIDCPVCIFQINNHSESPSVFLLSLPIENRPLIPEKKEVIKFTKKVKHYHQRAPPNFLFFI
ncbi:hypothetical protein [Persephonella sp.]